MEYSLDTNCIGIDAYQSINFLDWMSVRSLRRKAAGMAVPKVIRPITLKVQAGPTSTISLFIARLVTAPPSPPPA